MCDSIFVIRECDNWWCLRNNDNSVWR